MGNKRSRNQSSIHAHREQTPEGRDYLVMLIDHGPGGGSTNLSLLIDRDCLAPGFDKCFPIDRRTEHG